MVMPGETGLVGGMGVDANPIALSCRNQVARHAGQGCFPEMPRMTGGRRRTEKPPSIQSSFNVKKII
jgi:hypothetical protein